MRYDDIEVDLPYLTTNNISDGIDIRHDQKKLKETLYCKLTSGAFFIQKWCLKMKSLILNRP